MHAKYQMFWCEKAIADAKASHANENSVFVRPRTAVGYGVLVCVLRSRRVNVDLQREDDRGSLTSISTPRTSLGSTNHVNLVLVL